MKPEKQGRVKALQQYIVPCDDIRVVLNGGSDTVQSATLSCQWFLSSSILEKAKDVVIVVQTEKEFRSENAEVFGDRYIFDVTSAVAFLQFFSPGDHVITLFFLSFELESRSRKKILKRPHREKDRYWSHGLSVGDPSLLYGDTGILASTQVVASIPDGVFAERSTGPVAQWLWNLTKEIWGVAPRDECQYRWRMPVALLAASVIAVFAAVVAVVTAVLFLIRAVIFTLSAPLARLAVLFAGYRPVSLFEGVLDAWRLPVKKDLEWNVRRYDEYRLWKQDYKEGTGWDIRYIRVAPWEAVSVSLALWAVVSHHQTILSWNAKIAENLGYVTLVVCAGFVLVMAAVMAYRVPAVSDFIEDMVDRKRAPAVPNVSPKPPVFSSDQRRLFLVAGARAAKGAPLPATPRTVFWAAKRAVCKSFAR